MKLYEIAEDYRQALEELIDLDDEAVVDTLEALKGELQVKATNIVQYTQEMGVSIQAMKDAEKRMAARRKSLENKQKRIQDYVKHVMESSNVLKVETAEMEISIVNNPPKVIVETEEIIPEEFFKEERVLKLDKAKLKEALKEDSIMGAKLVQETRLKIK